MASDNNFFKEQNQKALGETKKTNKQKEKSWFLLL